MAHVLGEATVSELEGGLAGTVIRPGDAEYETARRVWNHAHRLRRQASPSGKGN